MNIGLATLLALGLGCATPPVPTPASSWPLASATPAAGHELKLRSGGRYVGLSIIGDQLVSPNESLLFRPGLLRGQGLEVLIEGDEARGHTGTAPVTLILERTTSSTRVRGSVGFKTIDFEISPGAVTGMFGACGYQLTWNGSRYDGYSCGSGWTWLELPVAMAQWSDAEVATVLALIL